MLLLTTYLSAIVLVSITGTLHSAISLHSGNTRHNCHVKLGHSYIKDVLNGITYRVTFFVEYGTLFVA